MLLLNRMLDVGLSFITAVTLLAMMLHVVLNAVLRFFFQTPIDGTNEIVAYWYLPIIALLGIPAAQLKKEHITVTLLLERVNERTAKSYKTLAFLVGTLLSCGFVWFGFQEAVGKANSGATAGVTQIITWPIYMLVPLAFLLLALLFIGEGIAVWGHRKKYLGNDSDEALPNENIARASR